MIIYHLHFVILELQNPMSTIFEVSRGPLETQAWAGVENHCPHSEIF